MGVNNLIAASVVVLIIEAHDNVVDGGQAGESEQDLRW
jgi:hypothetical protein